MEVSFGQIYVGDRLQLEHGLKCRCPAVCLCNRGNYECMVHNCCSIITMCLKYIKNCLIISSTYITNNEQTSRESKHSTVLNATQQTLKQMRYSTIPERYVSPLIQYCHVSANVGRQEVKSGSKDFQAFWTVATSPSVYLREISLSFCTEILLWQ